MGPMPTPAAAAEVFAAERPRLMGLAYRIVGTMADAEDVVQEAWIRCTATASAGSTIVEHPRAFINRVVVNLAIDHLRSARVRREQYVGHWLPDPIATDDGTAFGAPVSRHDVAYGLLVVLERLSPLERAVYVLSEVFDEAPAEIGAILDRRPEAVRQLLHRARAHVAAERPRHAIDDEAHQQLVATFFATVASGDVSLVERFLQQGVTLTSDGGGRAGTATRIVMGANAVARFLIGVAQKQPPEVALALGTFNGAVGVVGTVGDDGGARTDSVVLIETAAGPDGPCVARVFVLRNPARLARLNRAVNN